MNKQFEIGFLSKGRPPQCPPNPKYPDGIDVDTGERPACKAKLPYPADCIGTWIVHCIACDLTVGVTAAGRPDDPRSVMVPCKVSNAPDPSTVV